MFCDIPPKNTVDLWQNLTKNRSPLVAYGTGNGTDKLIKRLDGIGRTLSGVFASDDFVRGQSFHGMKVSTFSEIEKTYPDFTVLVAFGSRLPEVIDRVRAIAARHPLLIPDMPVAGETTFDSAYYSENVSALRATYDALCDEKSKGLFANILHYKLTGKPEHLFSATGTKEEIYDLVGRGVRSFVDVGAYRGDTAKEAVCAFPDLSHITAIEPDPKNAKKCEEVLCTLGIPYEVYPVAASDEEGDAVFYAGGNRNSSLASSSHGAGIVTVRKTPLDALPIRDADYIKFDVEGEEIPALFGARDLISRTRPVLRVAAYHRTEDLVALPPLISELLPDSDLYFRRTLCIPGWETDLIAVPHERKSK